MIIADLPLTEELRLADLISYDLLDTQSETDFEELVELAGDICDCPISLITLIDANRQWFLAKKGVETAQTSRDIAFCAHAILNDEVMTVENATEDERFSDNPLVTGDLNIRFYAGAPILSPTGHKLGTICVIDHIPKKLSKREERALTILSNQVTKLLDLRKKNALIRKRAEEAVALKAKIVSRVINNQEDEKKEIAFNLQEDFAQRLTTILLYLNMAENDDQQRKELLADCTKQLQDLIIKVCDLSYSITPYVADWVPAEDLISEYIEKVKVTFPFEIDYELTKTEFKNPANKALAVIRVIEMWLKLLAVKPKVSSVNIQVVPGEQIEIYIQDDGLLVPLGKLKLQVVENLIYDKITSFGGVIDLSISPAQRNMLKVVLPFNKIH